MVQVEMNNMYINIGANNGGEKTVNFPLKEAMSFPDTDRLPST